MLTKSIRIGIIYESEDIMDSWYNSYKQKIYFSEPYKTVTEQSSSFLRLPTLTFQKLQPIIENITYRKINLWSEKGLISDYRKKDSAEWRRFSYLDVIYLSIISDLRKFGVSLSKIKRILMAISHTTVTLFNQTKPTKVKFLELEHNLFKAINGNKILLLIREDDDDSVYFGSELNAILNHFGIWQASFPVLILPFYSYTHKLNDLSKIENKINDNTTIKALLTEKLKSAEISLTI